MNRTMLRYLLPALLSLVLAGCGSGGGNGTAVPTRAVVRLSTLATGSTPTIGGISVSLNLPSGVSLKVREDGSGQTADGVVVKSGAADSPNSTLIAKYSAASGTVSILIVKSDGFSAGEFATVTCDLAATAALSGDFSTSAFSAFDLTGTEIRGLEIAQAIELE